MFCPALITVVIPVRSLWIMPIPDLAHQVIGGKAPIALKNMESIIKVKLSCWTSSGYAVITDAIKWVKD